MNFAAVSVTGRVAASGSVGADDPWVQAERYYTCSAVKDVLDEQQCDCSCVLRSAGAYPDARSYVLH
jgi:hypothetical protein